MVEVCMVGMLTNHYVRPWNGHFQAWSNDPGIVGRRTLTSDYDCRYASVVYDGFYGKGC